jgi:hypothetical protein
VRIEADEQMPDCTLSLDAAPSNPVHPTGDYNRQVALRLCFLDQPALEVRY